MLEQIIEGWNIGKETVDLLYEIRMEGYIDPNEAKNDPEFRSRLYDLEERVEEIQQPNKFLTRLVAANTQYFFPFKSHYGLTYYRALLRHNDMV